MNVVSSPSKFIRLLQIADVVVGCTLAIVAGEKRYAPLTFKEIKPMLDKGLGGIGGTGLKIHPDFKYVNLYHWIAGDATYVKNMRGWNLPKDGHPYYDNDGL